MNRIAAIDTGRHTTKVCTANKMFQFPSILGEWHDRTGFRETKYGNYDLEIEFNGERWFGGTLAKFECDFKDTMHHENAKYEVENLILILCGLHLSFNGGNVCVITGQPIDKHTDQNKEKIKNMLKGYKTITINGETKHFNIMDVVVACESGVSCYSLQSYPDLLRILDFGSATVNGATMIEGKYNKNQSRTLPFGLETNEKMTGEQLKRMARNIISQYARKWEYDNRICLVGGGASLFYPYIKEAFPNTNVHPKPELANVIGMYQVAKKLWMANAI